MVMAPAGGDAGQQGGGQVADRRVMVEPAVDDEAVVFGSELGVGVAGLVGDEPDVASQPGVSLFGDPGSGFGTAGLVHLGDHP